ncbi:LysR family transcriptional regulator [Nocardia stercoris]|uniref:LysR family transcriptional regulator n=1 Tax=Nocardia stercoris TaxID=2483361 RepID=UPI0018F67ACA|nr:LysR substrate-binding domain-containing protein [Nocardia stercoris]
MRAKNKHNSGNDPVAALNDRRPVERYEMEAFLAVADELHFGRAAATLHMSAGRVSQTIKALERRFGAALFERTSRQVALTPIGRQLAADLQPALRQIRGATDRAIAAGRGFAGTLRIGFVGAASGALITAAAEAFSDEHPETVVTIREVQIADGVDSWRSEAVDMALVGRPVTEPDLVTGRTLISEPRLLAVPSGHPLAQRDSLSVEDLTDIPLLRLPTSVPESIRAERTPSRTPAGRVVSHGPIAHTFQEILTLIAAGAGGFVVGGQAVRYYRRPDVRFVPFHDAPPVEWGFVWRASRETARVRAFEEVALRIATTREPAPQPTRLDTPPLG